MSCFNIHIFINLFTISVRVSFTKLYVHLSLGTYSIILSLVSTASFYKLALTMGVLDQDSLSLWIALTDVLPSGESADILLSDLYTLPFSVTFIYTPFCLLFEIASDHALQCLLRL